MENDLRNELTEQNYWEKGYQAANIRNKLIDIDDFRQLPFRRIVDLIKSVGLENKNVLEVGAGNSDVLLSLAKTSGGKAQFSGLDYTDSGCEALQVRSSINDLEINVINCDMFNPWDSLISSFDVLYSIGVVEHFSNLPMVIRALEKYLKPGGIMITVIPNMRGSIGYLTKSMNPTIYNLHNPHNLESLESAHQNADMSILQAEYLCSNNFGVLSSCASQQSGFSWRLYYLLSRISKLIWYVESHIGDFPRTLLFSPYLFVVARKVK